MKKSVSQKLLGKKRKKNKESKKRKTKKWGNVTWEEKKRRNKIIKKNWEKLEIFLICVCGVDNLGNTMKDMAFGNVMSGYLFIFFLKKKQTNI